MKITVLSKKEARKGSFYEIAFDPDIAESRMVEKKSGKNVLEIKPIAAKKINQRQLVLILRQIIFFAKKYGIKKVALDFSKIEKMVAEINVATIGEMLAVNFNMANYEFVKYKETPKKGWSFVEEVVVIADEEKQKELERGIEKGKIIGDEINASRELSNMPGGEMTPEILVKEIYRAIRGTGIKMKVLEEKEMKKLGMGAILGVSRGSCEKPKFIILDYAGAQEKAPLVLVGKAITFDTGGLNLKPSDSILEMHMDMSGGAAVAYAVIAAAKLKIEKRFIGIIPAAENMPSGESYRPGDILRSMSGKTIEVLNTDAEGRIILADALTYAERFNPRLVVDVATLTGAASIALGERASAILSKDDELVKKLMELGEQSGDYVWPLPLWNEYEVEVKGINGDVANIKSEGNSRYGGTINGAMFLYQFAKKLPKWIHIDMAPKMTAVFDEFLAKGSCGSPIRLLVKIIEEL
jgi:leucyl aminopeptidase